ncbi:MAG: hypothetical protein JW867_02245 [Candidatus Omnitrophica bacterium]|nr:hypothetical protein [Candidatus Omnitrophota bacterium]
MTITKAEQRIKDLKEISLVIDSWDDVFSDFDPRPLNERTVSGDFVEELKKRYRETQRGTFIINIYAPVFLKNVESERMVTQRLKRHFRYVFMQKKRNIIRRRVRGLIFIFVGISSLTFLTLATYHKFLSKLSLEMISILLMPLGWFGFWEGLSKLVDTSPAFIHEEKLFEKLSKANYRFSYIEEEAKK